MKIHLILLLLMTSTQMLAARPSDTSAKGRTVQLTFLHTSDIHGSLFGYDFLKHTPVRHGLSALYACARHLQREMGDRLILTDGGDCLQGQPVAYYYNYVDTLSTHLVARVMNDMGYAAVVPGNHDFETGHKVYDRWFSQLSMPVLGANVIDSHTQKPYLTPYIIIEREGVRIALLGMITSAIPCWLPQNLWAGLRFENVEASCEKWVRHIQQAEHPDLLVGLFHSGYGQGIQGPEGPENVVEDVASRVEGIDLILYGHDHRTAIHKVKQPKGGEVTCVAPGAGGTGMARVDVSLTFDGEQHIRQKDIKARMEDASLYAESVAAELFEADYVDERLAVRNWVNQPVGRLACDMYELDAFFGPSLFMDFIHQVQLKATAADISFTAPLSFNNVLKAGPLLVSDLFHLYKFENYLYTLRLSGREVKDYLEMSYGLWISQMHTEEDAMLLLKPQGQGGGARFVNPTFNFDSAAGIYYTVDVSKPVGQRITILSMADGSPFDMNRDYRVALNSYRGNGGGELLTQGAGIPREKLQERILWTSDVELRQLVMQHITQREIFTPSLLNSWRFIPEEWVKKAAARDRKRLEGNALPMPAL